MRPIPLHVDREPEHREAESEATATDRVERISRREPADLVDVGRCPRCRAPLVARMGCHGPYFHCLCAESGAGVE
jgi:hypothetical protein